MQLKRIFSIIVTLMISILVDWYFSFSHEMLIPISACIVMLTPVGNLIFHAMIRYVLMLVGVIIFSWFFISPMMESRGYDITIGALMGVVSNILLFPRRADDIFRLAILPILVACEAYANEIVKNIFSPNPRVLEIKKNQLEIALKKMPMWVFLKGFDYKLKPGHQFFLIKLHQVAEILLSLHSFTRDTFSPELLDEMKNSLLSFTQKIKLLFSALITVCELKKINEGIEDGESEWHSLDQRFQSWLPVNASYITLPAEDVRFYGVIYSLADLRTALIQLAQALR